MVNTHRHKTPSMENLALHPQLSRSQRTAVAPEPRNSKIQTRFPCTGWEKSFCKCRVIQAGVKEAKLADTCRYRIAVPAFSMIPTPNRISSSYVLKLAKGRISTQNVIPLPGHFLSVLSPLSWTGENCSVSACYSCIKWFVQTAPSALFTVLNLRAPWLYVYSLKPQPRHCYVQQWVGYKRVERHGSLGGKSSQVQRAAHSAHGLSLAELLLCGCNHTIS